MTIQGLINKLEELKTIHGAMADVIVDCEYVYFQIDKVEADEDAKILQNIERIKIITE